MSDGVKGGGFCRELTVENCVSCGVVLDLQGVLPLTRVECPGCGETMEVLRRFGPFDLEGLLGQGGLGAVYKAHDRLLQRSIAVKILQPAWSGDPVAVAQIEREAAAIASINHPGVVRVFSTGMACGMFYMGMELADQGALDSRMESVGRLDEAEVLNIFRQVAEGLFAAQKAGLIHRDIKPGNILFGRDGRVQIVDFGLALKGQPEPGGDSGGELWGTPYYIAPERLSGGPGGVHSDMYALGASMWHALAGEPPYPSQSTSSLELLEQRRRPVDARRLVPRINPRIAAVLNRCLAFEAGDRFPDYEALLFDLRAASVGGGSPAPRFLNTVWILIAVFLFLLCWVGSRWEVFSIWWNGAQSNESGAVSEFFVSVEGDGASRLRVAFRALVEGDPERCVRILRLVALTPRGESTAAAWSRVGLAAVYWMQDQQNEVQSTLRELDGLVGWEEMKFDRLVQGVRSALVGHAELPSALDADGGFAWHFFSALRAISEGDFQRARAAMEAAREAGARARSAEAQALASLVPEVLRELQKVEGDGTAASVEGARFLRIPKRSNALDKEPAAVGDRR